jgi:hypothetical protein
MLRCESWGELDAPAIASSTNGATRVEERAGTFDALRVVTRGKAEIPADFRSTATPSLPVRAGAAREAFTDRVASIMARDLVPAASATVGVRFVGASALPETIVVTYGHETAP